MADPLKSLDLGKKLGPLPRGAWVGIIVVGVVGGLYLRDRSSSSSSASTAADTTNPDIDPATDETYEQEAAQAAAAQSDAAGAGAGTGSGSSGGTNTDDSGELAQLDSDLNTGLSAIQQQEASDTATQTANDPGSPTYNISVTPPVSAAPPPPAPKLAPGAIRLTFGATKPTAPAGYTVEGEGNGYWEAVPKKAPIIRPTNPPTPEKPSSHKPTVTTRKPVTSKGKKK